MSLKNDADVTGEKGANGLAGEGRNASFSAHVRGRQFSVDPEDQAMVTTDQNKLHRNLRGRHMQMIAM